MLLIFNRRLLCKCKSVYEKNMILTKLKNVDMIIGELTFSEHFEGRVFDTTLRYIYDINKVLIRIEEHTDNGMITEWDRDSIEHELINDVVTILKDNYTSNQMKEFK